MSSLSNKRPAQYSGASGDKRQRLSGYASEIIESEESEASPENYAGETKESDSDRRGREKKEREQKKREGIAKRQRQRIAKMAANHIKPITANIGGNRVKKNGIIEFEGGTDYQFESRSRAKKATGISISAIAKNIKRKRQSRGTNGIFKGQKVMFINEPVDTSNRVHCEHCNKHYGTKTDMIKHVRAKHPEVPLPPAREFNRMPDKYKTFTPPITPKQYSFIVEKVASNIQNDLRKCDLKTLMALVDGYEPWPSNNIKGAARKYHFTEKQILESIANNEQLTIGGGTHKLQLGLGRTTMINLAGHTVTFSWKHKVTEEDKIKLLAMNNPETRTGTYHMIARLICEHMNKEGMFANENVTDDNGGLIKHGFVFEKHGGLFAISFDRIEDNYTVNGQTFHKLHYPNLDDVLENIRVVAFMANVPCKASTAKIQDRYDIYKNKSEDQQKKDIDVVLEISHKKYHNGKSTPLYGHAHHFWADDKQCHGAFATAKAYWQHMLVLLKKQEGLCKVAKIPMSLESGPWLMSCDAIDPLLGHVPGNLRLVFRYNNVTDTSKQNEDLTDTRPHSPTTEIHDEYWRIVR